MGIRDAFLAGLAKQLGHPDGLRGQVVGTMLNRGNRKPVTEAVAALELTGGETALHSGFGGGPAPARLLACTGPNGSAPALGISATMLGRARRTVGRELA